MAKKSRYSGEGSVASIACSHKNASCAAVTLTPTDLAHIKGQLYSTDDKVTQDSIILSHMDATPCKRRRPQVEDEQKRRQRDVSIKFSVLKENKTKVPVCQASFLSIFCVKKDRVQNVAKYWLEHGKARSENRGGSREKKQVIGDHIQSFSCRASLYARRGAPGRKFLEQNHCEYQVSYSLYYSIFMYDFNLAFGQPAKDVCSICVKHRIAINNPDSSPEEKRDKLFMYTLHHRLARQVYHSLNDVADSFTICFDVMENLLLPKSAIGQTYYSWHLYLYVFGVVCHRGRGEPQSRHDINLYTWMESENSKDSNTFALALQHFLTKVAQEDLCQFQSLRLFSESCYVKNKNINVLAILFALRSQLYPQLDIQYFFPIRGHSFLPADRVFGRVEQDIRKQPTILLPEEYVSILRKHGNVHQYGKDWQCYD